MFGSFVAGAVVIGSALKNWGFQETDAFSLENIEQLFLGTCLLLFSYFLSKNKTHYPLKSHSEQNKTTAEIGKAFYPKKIELHTNLHGLPVTHACGAPSPIRLKAIQINPGSDNREKDYEKNFYNFLTGEIVEYDKTKPDHRELNEHFLWMMEQAGSPNFPGSYLKQYNIIKPEPDGEKKAETLH
jgi:hypothetical protein